jgi:hypothetical protein
MAELVPTVAEKLQAAEEHLSLLQTKLISLQDAPPREPNEHLAETEADLKQQIAEIMQVIEYQQGGAAFFF